MRRILKSLPLMLLSILILSAVILQIHNIFLFPINRGPDALEHIRYVTFLKTHLQLPLPHQGWEYFQPPLYYLTASIFNQISQVKFLGLAIWLVLGFFSAVFFYKRFNNIFWTLTGTLLVISFPVVAYLTPIVNNDLLSAILISFGLIIYALNVSRKFSLDILFAIVLSLAILTKSIALILLFAVTFDIIIFSRKHIINLFAIILIVFCLTGWFFIRNTMRYGNPFIINLDMKEFHLQNARPRTLSFFTDTSAILKADLYNAHHYSFFAGTYYSFFYDGHNVVIPVQPFSKAGTLLVILSLPLLIFFIYGLILELRRKRKINLFISYASLLIASYLYLNIKYPIAGSVDARYLVSLIIPVSYFILQAIRKADVHKNIILLYIFIYMILLIKNFWILKHWY